MVKHYIKTNSMNVKDPYIVLLSRRMYHMEKKQENGPWALWWMGLDFNLK